MKTHYAVVNGGTVIDARSSASRHVGGTGKYAPYTFAAIVEKTDGTFGNLGYSGTRALAEANAQTWRNRKAESHASYADWARIFVAPVVVTETRRKVGETIEEAAASPRCRARTDGGPCTPFASLPIRGGVCEFCGGAL